MKSNFEELARAAADRQAGTVENDPETEARKQKKKKLAIAMLVLNTAALIFVAVGFFFDMLPFTLIGAGIALVSFVLSRICKRI